MPSVLGIDLGLSGARAAVMDSGGRALGRGRADCIDVERSGGEMVHDPTGWASEMTTAARAALADAGVRSVDVIAVGALGPAPVVLDSDLRPMAPSAISSMDPVGPRLEAWRRGAPALFERAAWVVDVTGYLVSTLVGRPVMDTITANDHEPFGDRVAPAPEPEDAQSMAGGLTRDAADRLGLAEGTPVTVGTYDTFVDLAGLGVREVGDAVLLLGSTLNIGVIRSSDEAPKGIAGVSPCRSRMVRGWLDLRRGSCLGLVSRALSRGGTSRPPAGRGAARAGRRRAVEPSLPGR